MAGGGSDGGGQTRTRGWHAGMWAIEGVVGGYAGAVHFCVHARCVCVCVCVLASATAAGGRQPQSSRLGAAAAASQQLVRQQPVVASVRQDSG